MPLRVVSWNCNMALRPKFEALLSLPTDVAIIQECAAPDGDAGRGWRPNLPRRRLDRLQRAKGAGHLHVRRPDPPQALIVHRRASRSTCLWRSVAPAASTCWACGWPIARKIPPGRDRRPGGARSASTDRFWPPRLPSSPATSTACPSRCRRDPKASPGASVVELLADAGLVNAGHCHERRRPARMRCAARTITSATSAVAWWWIISSSRPWSARRLTAFEVGDPHDWLRWSDHVPLVVEFDLNEREEPIHLFNPAETRRPQTIYLSVSSAPPWLNSRSGAKPCQ